VRREYSVQADGHVEAESHSQSLIAELARVLPEEEAQQSQSFLMLAREGAPKDDLIKMIGDLKGKIEPWRVDALATLKKSVDAIHACATTMKGAVTQWPQKKSTSDVQGEEHTSCRSQESEKFENKEHWKGQTAEKKEIMDTECKIFEDIKKEIRAVKASYSNGDVEAYLEGVCDEIGALLPRFEDAKKKCADAKAEHVRVSKVYKQAESEYTVQCDGCNEKQTETEVSYCQYALATKGTCDSYGTCYEDKVAEYKSVREIINGEFKLKEVEYRVYSRIECLLPILGTNKADEIEKCRQKKYKLDEIVAPGYGEEETCTAEAAYPGTDGYYTAHMEPLPENAKGNPVAKCVGMSAELLRSWLVRIPDSKFGGSWINYGTPLPVILKRHLGGNEWMLGLVEAPYLKLEKIRVTSETTYEWIATRYDNAYDASCARQATFTLACFKGTDPGRDAYPVILSAEKEAQVAQKAAAAKCSDITYTGDKVWGKYTGSGVALGQYTDNELQFIGCVGNGCNANTFYCKDTADGIKFGTTQRSAMRACAGVSSMEECKYNGCCKKAGGLCNSPDKAVDAEKLCQQLGYRTGTVEKVPDNTCPEAGWLGKEWSSDYVNSHGYGKSYTCSQ